MTPISIQEYKFIKMERKFFEFYKYIEEFFEEKKTERDIILRLYLTVRYLADLAVCSQKHIKDNKATESFKKSVKAEAKWLQTIVEVLDD